MSRKKTKPLTAKQLAEMDRKHETKKAAMINTRGVEGWPKVTASVTDAPKAPPATPVPSKAELAAFELLADSTHFDVAIAGDIDKLADHVMSLGEVAGRVHGLQEGLTLPRSAAEARAQNMRPAMGHVLQEVFIELQKAVRGHAPIHSPHEGVAVIREELDELWDEVKTDRGRQKSARMEAIQTAAMAVRYVLDLDPR